MQVRVVHSGLTLAEVVHEQVTHRPAGQAVAVDELFTAELPLRTQASHRWRGATEHAGSARQSAEARTARRRSGVLVLGETQQFEASGRVRGPTARRSASSVGRGPSGKRPNAKDRTMTTSIPARRWRE